MPVVYETAAPAGAIADLAIQGGRARGRLASDANPYARVPGGGGIIDTGDTQQAVFLRNQDNFRREADSLNRTGVTNQSLAEARWAQEQQAERFRLQAELQQTELTQAEHMRLQRMKNAVGEVASDATLAPEEKAALITQLKTGIDPMEMRLARQRVQAEEQVKQQRAELFDMQAAYEKKKLDILSLDTEKRFTFRPDAQALAEIVADMTDALGPMAKLVPPEFIRQQALAEATRQGLGVQVYTKANGDLEILDAQGNKARGSAAGGRAGEPAHESGLKPQQFANLLKSVRQQVDREAKETVKNDDGTVSPRYPRLSGDTAEAAKARNDQVRERMREMGFPEDMEQYSSGPAQPPAASGPRGYDPSRSPWRKGQQQQPPAAASDATQVRNPRDMRLGGAAGGEDPAKTAAFRLSDVDDAAAKINAAKIPDADKQKANALMRETQEIIRAEPDPKTRSEKAAKRLAELADALDPILEKTKISDAGKKAGVTGPYGLDLGQTLGENW